MIFLEAVLDLFPHRPRVDAGRLVRRAEVVSRLRERGYTLTCDPDGTVLGELEVARAAVDREAQELERLLGPSRPGRRPKLDEARPD